MKNKDFNLELFQKQLKKELRPQREKLNLSRQEVADSVNRSSRTYQHWELTGESLTDIESILKTFHKLKFTTSKIINILQLPPLNSFELKNVIINGDTLKNMEIDKNGICSYVTEKITNLGDNQIEYLLDILYEERIKRHRTKYSN